MFTTQGSRSLLRTVADSGVVTHMSVGIGNTAATTADSRLDCEVLRLPIVTATPDFVNNVIVYKATIPAEEAVDAYEIGLVSSPVSPNTTLTDFTESNFWTNGAASTLNSRVEGSSWLSNPAVSTAQTVSGNVAFTWSDADEIVVAYFVGSNVSNATIRFQTDGSNYYSYSLPVTAGYRITRIARSAFTTTGAPGAINSVALITTATAGGAAALYWDAIISVDTADRDPDLVIRRVLGANINKAAGISRDLEYTVTVTAT